MATTTRHTPTCRPGSCRGQPHPQRPAAARLPPTGRARRQPGSAGDPGCPRRHHRPDADSPQLRRQINAGRYSLLVALELARELGDPRGAVARLVDARARALAMAARWLAERTPEQDRLAHIDVRSRGQHGACRP
jgi:hypothetical protein